MTTKTMRTLTIRDYHMCRVTLGNCFSITPVEAGNEHLYRLTFSTERIRQYIDSSPLIADIKITLIAPGTHHIHTDSIMDIIPVSTKVLGKSGEGITHTITGVYVMLTGIDTEGTPICAFGNSDGWLDEQLALGMAGTPGPTDYLISFAVTLTAKAGVSRSGPNAAHHACDLFCQEIREILKKQKGSLATESHRYEDTIRNGAKKVVLVKLVSGQGSMYDTHVFGQEPSSYDGSRSVIDITGAPLLLSPNEYRDGAIRAMY